MPSEGKGFSGSLRVEFVVNCLTKRSALLSEVDKVNLSEKEDSPNFNLIILARAMTGPFRIERSVFPLELILYHFQK